MFIVSAILIALLNSCNSQSEKLQNRETNIHCLKDTTLNNGNFLKYKPSLKDSICFLSVSINGIVKQNIDSFYIDENDCRMIPKLIYNNDSCLFLVSGSGFTYRKLYTYCLNEKSIIKTELQFDNLESDLKYSYYPYTKNGNLFVLKIDTLQNAIEADTKIKLQRNLIKEVSINKNQITIIQTDNKEISTIIK
ncbi:MAG: hypothetical protein QM528_09325 [Phycisphaerales bacterium]|nr:hypothetical protein [Phycisphaerales bacterium]